MVGDTRCPIVDTWWQTETGSIMITPAAWRHQPQTRLGHPPLFGVQPVLLDDKGHEIDGPGSGVLAIKASWPSQIRSVFGDHQRMIDTYFNPIPATTSPATARAATRTATTGSPAGSTT